MYIGSPFLVILVVTLQSGEIRLADSQTIAHASQMVGRLAGMERIGALLDAGYTAVC